MRRSTSLLLVLTEEVWQSNTFDAELVLFGYMYQIDSIDNFICSNSIVPSVSYITIGSNDINIYLLTTL